MPGNNDNKNNPNSPKHAASSFNHFLYYKEGYFLKDPNTHETFASNANVIFPNKNAADKAWSELEGLGEEISRRFRRCENQIFFVDYSNYNNTEECLKAIFPNIKIRVPQISPPANTIITLSLAGENTLQSPPPPYQKTQSADQAVHAGKATMMTPPPAYQQTQSSPPLAPIAKKTEPEATGAQTRPRAADVVVSASPNREMLKVQAEEAKVHANMGKCLDLIKKAILNNAEKMAPTNPLSKQLFKAHGAIADDPVKQTSGTIQKIYKICSTPARGQDQVAVEQYPELKNAVEKKLKEITKGKKEYGKEDLKKADLPFQYKFVIALHLALQKYEIDKNSPQHKDRWTNVYAELTNHLKTIGFIIDKSKDQEQAPPSKRL